MTRKFVYLPILAALAVTACDPANLNTASVLAQCAEATQLIRALPVQTTKSDEAIETTTAICEDDAPYDPLRMAGALAVLRAENARLKGEQ